MSGSNHLPPLWEDNTFSFPSWGVRQGLWWGLENLSIINDLTGRFPKVLRVRYPASSASPAVTRNCGAPSGGAQFFADLGLAPTNSLFLRYFVRFAPDFHFMKGGKLPGLCGGTVFSGGKKPDGSNGFSTRYMWRQKGDGEVYAYLPACDDYGLSLGRGNWRFRPGAWQMLQQQVSLNTCGAADGVVRVWFDEQLVLDATGLVFRTTDHLKIQGLFFSTFFGGGDPSWATPADTWAEFAAFAVGRQQIGLPLSS